ncbi:MAG: flippase-like domain-containing protein [Bacteroidia bacterium]|nr:flippase-like domain-containing protein [Bacteroidia bacterium]NNJ54481.1 flippase-like domain-containing protein [Bacteroidia bacterium]
MTKKVKTTINTVIFLCIGAAMFYWALSKEDTSQLISEIENADVRWILLSMLCGILSHLARALRWKLLIKPMGYKAKTANSFHAVILGYLVNIALPRVGEITRPAVLAKLDDIPFNKLVGTVLIERVVDLLITLLIAISIFFIQFDIIYEFASSMFENTSSSVAIFYGVLGMLALILLYIVYRNRYWFYALPIIKKFKDFIEGLLDGVRTIFNLEKKGLFVFYSLFIWVMYFFMPFFVLYALDGTSHLGASAALTVLLFGTAAMIVPVPGGVGTFEVLVPAALTLYGIGSLVGSSYALITHAIQFIVIIGVGVFSIIYFVVKSQKIKKNNALEQDNSG